MSRENLVAINTAVGQSKLVNIPHITAQGGTWGPLLCSNSIDTVGQWAESHGQYYRYKNRAKVLMTCFQLENVVSSLLKQTL